jgi:uncharacterized protein (TIGR03067 family)
MQKVILAAYLFVFIFISGELRAEQPPSELDKLQGEWQATQFIGCGYEFPKHVVDHLKVTIKANHLSYTIPKFDDPEKLSNARVETEFVLGPGKPQTIDVRMVQGRTKSDPLRGVYELDGDVLRICLSRGEIGASMERVTTLQLPKGSNATQLTLKRCKESAPSGKIADGRAVR